MKNKLWRITLDTNPEDCNLNCIMCEEHSPYSNFKQKLFDKTGLRYRRMPKEWIEKIFVEAKELGVQEIIPSTMGEPLTYKYINLFFDYAEKYGIKINLTTNGTFPGKTVEEWAKLIIPVTSDTKISLNGATKQTAEKIMTGLNFEKQIENIKRFTSFRNKYFEQTGYYSHITFQLTFMQNNMHELPEIIKLAAVLDIDRIKGHHLWTHFKEIEQLSFKYDEKSMQKWNEIVDKAFESAEKYRKQNGDKILLEQIGYLKPQETTEVPFEYECPFLEKELWISATGKISPCCAPDEQRNSLGDFGHYPKTSLKQVLESNIYKDLVKNYKQHPLCKVCVMRKPKIQTVENFRDFAKFNNYIKEKILYRSATLTKINTNIIDDFLSQRNITTIIDLRTKDEIKESPYNNLIINKFKYINIAFDPHAVTSEFAQKYEGLSGMDILYYFLIRENKNNIKQVFNVILENKGAIIIHCTAGKDRTGLIAFLISKLLNVSCENILMDYMESRGDADKNRLNIFNNAIKEQGGIINYLQSCGLSNQMIQDLTQKLNKSEKYGKRN